MKFNIKLKTILALLSVPLAVCCLTAGFASGQADSPRRDNKPKSTAKASAPRHLSVPSQNTQISAPGHLTNPNDPAATWYDRHEIALIAIVNSLTGNDAAVLAQLKMKLASRKSVKDRIDYITAFILNLSKN